MRHPPMILLLAACFATLPLAARAEEEDIEDRLRRLERLVEQQQRQLQQRDERISRLETTRQLDGAVKTMPALDDSAKTDDPNAMSVRWDKGLRFKTRDGATSISIGGRMQWQLGYLSEDEDTQNQLGITERDFVQLRRAYLDMSGTFYRHVFWAAQFNFAADGDSEIEDVYLGVQDLPVIGRFRIGHFKEPFGMETVESSKYLQLIERSLLSQCFAPDNSFGLEFHNSHLDDRLTWSLGAFREVDASGSIRSDFNYMGTGRITGLPWWASEGRRHLHLGIAGRVAETSASDHNEDVRFRARPSVRTENRFIDTGVLDHIDGDFRLGAELAFNWDRFNLVAEWMGVWLDADRSRRIYRDIEGQPPALTTVPAEDVFLHGFSVTASYWLTGESRQYDRRLGYYGRTSPKRNFALDGSGFGAVQLAARFHYLDYKDSDAISSILFEGDEDTANRIGLIEAYDAGVGQGTLWGAVAGVSWLLNPNTRIMANYNFIQTDRIYFDVMGTDRWLFREQHFNTHALVFMFQVDW